MPAGNGDRAHARHPEGELFGDPRATANPRSARAVRRRRAAVTRVAGSLLGGVVGLVLRHLLGPDDEDDDVVHDGARVRRDPRRGHEACLGLRPGDELAAMVVRLQGRCVRLRELKREVDLEELRARALLVLVLVRGVVFRLRARLTLRGALVQPRQQDLLLPRGEVDVVDEGVAVVGRLPRRHRAVDDRRPDGRRVRGDLLVRRQRKGADLAGAVTRRAACVDDGLRLAVVRERWRVLGLRVAAPGERGAPAASSRGAARCGEASSCVCVSSSRPLALRWDAGVRVS